ncbi:MAG: Hsp20/alpha crystallin family protein [Thermoanaerobaculum sp.]|nr:Hsp20/alpha crystallin family protein [Thermoanaerobaculum sp.]
MRRKVSFGVELVRFRQHLRQILEQAASPGLPAGTWAPLVDLAATDHEIIVRVDLPGAGMSSLKVEVMGQELRISGEKPSPPPGRRYHQVERSYGRFVVEVVLPEKVQARAGAARFKAGVLEVRLPKERELPPEPVPIPVEEERS